MALLAIQRITHALCAIATCAFALACKRQPPPDHGPDLQFVSEALRPRATDSLPRTSPFFDGTKVTLVAARGETVGFQVLARNPAPTSLLIKANGVTVRTWSTLPAQVKRSSTKGMYGETRGTGSYRDVLVPVTQSDATPDKGTGYLFELVVARDADVGMFTGHVVIDHKWIPVELTIVDVTLPDAPPIVWAYYDPLELEWAKLGASTSGAPSEHEKRCVALFRDYGVALLADMTVATWPARKDLLGDFPYVKVKLPEDPAQVGAEVRAWIEATAVSGKLPFAIPIDEPRKPDARAQVKALSAAVREAGGGASTFLYAVTAEPNPELGDAIDLYITLKAKRSDSYLRWTYNGAPPRAGTMVLDALSPGTRTWGWIAWRYNIPVWYVWEALYWHDRYNRKGAPLPGRALTLDDAISFDGGEDHGNLDGVLALPGDDAMPCRPTLRLAAIRRGLQDRQLIELAAHCKPEDTAKLVEQMVPRALGDLPGKSAPGEGHPSWPTDDVDWERARRKLLELAAACK